MSSRTFTRLIIGTIALGLFMLLSGCCNDNNSLIGTWYEWDQFNPNGFVDNGFAVTFNGDSTGVMWVHDNFEVSPKFIPDTFVWSRQPDGKLLYKLKSSSSWNARDNQSFAEYRVDERGVLQWVGHELKRKH